MIEIYVGHTGQGKTYMSAVTVLDLLSRNRKWYEKKKTDRIRKVATNIALDNNLVKEYKDYIIYWNDLEQLVELREADIIFDDMAAYLDSQRWSDTPMSVKRWLRLHEHYGCDIYGNAQDFLTIDPSVRRLTSSVIHVKKLIGSPRPSATKPKIKKIWGILISRRVKEELIDKEKIKYDYEGWFSITLIKKAVCKVFDTTQDLQMGEWPPLHHIERSCSICLETKIRHV